MSGMLSFVIGAIGSCAGVFAAATHSVALPIQSPGPLVRFSNGFFVAYDGDNARVWSFSRDGRQSIQFTFDASSVPDLHRARVRTVTAAPDGTLAISAGAYNADGAFASILAWIGPDGRLNRIVRTTPYAAAQLAFASDGTLWAVGRLHDVNFEDVAEHDVIHRYDREGRLIGTALPIGSLTRKTAAHPSSDCYIAAAKDGVGVFFEASGEWVLLDLAGSVVEHTTVPPIASGDHVDAVAFGSEREVIFSVSADRGDHFRFVRWSQGQNRFASVELTDMLTLPFAYIAGVDGGDLVIGRNEPRFEWVSLKE